MRGDRVLIRSLDFRDFWVLDISRPSHSTRETGGPSTVGWGSRGPPSGEAPSSIVRRSDALCPAFAVRKKQSPQPQCGQGLTATPDSAEDIRPIPRRMWLAG